MQLEGNRVVIRRVRVEDAQELLELHLRNRAFFDPYRPQWAEEDFTLEAMRKRLERQQVDWEQDRGYEFHVYEKESGVLIGSVSLMFVKRGPGQSALLGYEMDQACNGKGYMTEAVRLCLDFGFGHANLHRIEAGVMLTNHGSNRVLEKVGFIKEGVNRKNVRINGQWEDHVLWAILDTDWREIQARVGNTTL